jgi:serine/threonine protein kinase
VRGDWLRPVPAGLDFLLLTAIGAAAGFGLGALRPLRAIGTGLFAALFVTAGAAALLMWCNSWFSWTVPVYVQIPAAAAWSVFASLSGVCRPKPLVPEHELIRCIGKGAYGEVWLARNVIGIFRAVKLIRRAHFQSVDPYEREFRGMQKYMPISLHHPALLPVLQVGRDDQAGHFYYVMELGDDVTGRAECEPARYVAKTLLGELLARQRLPAVECARLGAALADALDYLHRQQLIHRDVKPGNIVFVRGQPKLADIGLVTDVDPQRGPVSYLGTEGFMAPEGPGVSGDIYALGKVLYQALTGFDVRQNLALPVGFENWPDAPAMLALNEVICRACDPNPADRYPDAGQMRDDLRRIG